MEKRQSAIEWLIKEFDLEKHNLNSTLDIARSIEEQQHLETWDNALTQYNKRGKNYINDQQRIWEDFNEYFKPFKK